MHNNSGAGDDFRLTLVCGNRRSGTTLLNNILCRSADTNDHVAEVQPLSHLLAAFDWSEENYERITSSFFTSRQAFFEFRKRACDDFIKGAWIACGRPRNLVLKNPELSFHIADLLSIWPSAHIVACTRDPRDQIASEIDVIERRPERGQEPPDISSLCTAFARYADPVMKAAKNEPRRVLLVRYEDWVADDSLVRQIVDFCGLSLPNFSAADKWIDSRNLLEKLLLRPSRSDLYGKPASAERIGSFTNKLTKIQIAEIERILGAHMSELGYKPTEEPS